MPSSFMLDTNAYFLLFEGAKALSYSNLIEKIRVGKMKFFYISEITSMEIHSVLGKYRRETPHQPQRCDRKIVSGSNIETCSNTWITQKRKPMKLSLFLHIQKLIADAEARRGDIQATILKLDNNSIEKARNLLISYADRYNFGSHDALIAGSFITASESGMNLTLITSDRGLKAVLKEESMSLYDPLTPQSLTF